VLIVDGKEAGQSELGHYNSQRKATRFTVEAIDYLVNKLRYDPLRGVDPIAERAAAAAGRAGNGRRGR
jgi:hypothetical protein